MYCALIGNAHSVLLLGTIHELQSQLQRASISVAPSLYQHVRKRHTKGTQGRMKYINSRFLPGLHDECKGSDRKMMEAYLELYTGKQLLHIFLLRKQIKPI